jgi:hypothetical protein
MVSDGRPRWGDAWASGLSRTTEGAGTRVDLRAGRGRDLVDVDALAAAPLCWATATVETVVFVGGSSVTV